MCKCHEQIQRIKYKRSHSFQNSIRPFGGIDDISYDVRKLENGSEYIAVKEGFLLRAVIAPFDAVTDEFVGVLNKIYGLSMNALSDKRE